MWLVVRAVIGADITTLNGHSLEAYSNKDLIAIHQDPLAAPGRQIVNNGSTTIWACPLSGNRSAAVLLNRGNNPIDISVSWSQLDALSPSLVQQQSASCGVERGQDKREVTDVWQHKSLG